jgi:hypothetical protein
MALLSVENYSLCGYSVIKNDSNDVILLLALLILTCLSVWQNAAYLIFRVKI